MGPLHTKDSYAAVKGSYKLVMAGPSDVFLREKGKVLNNLNLYSMLLVVFRNKRGGNIYIVDPHYS